ncbi:hypothetical protein [Xenorhabdus bovienii]|uniref:hypothetical protein n=1 Tax=Xenorhabdus bovienii TaxID=40576 RepID=UPI0023B27A1C|nr:hypothetical protein [Xenorhabdus bovienii]MDE9537310.1 hypothetical protein [Xenorhabdus bovienii]MDE9590143.1 hypothetical protein [Xenorhabdus bovienii]
MRTEVDLVYFEKDREERTQLSKYYVSHNNLETILDQTLLINRDQFGEYIAKMEFENFPRLQSEKEAALRLADWMRRMSEAIEDHWQDKKQSPEAVQLIEEEIITPQSKDTVWQDYVNTECKGGK